MQKLTTRRGFLEALGLSGAGLCLGLHAFGAEPTNEPAGDQDPKPKTSSPEQEKKSIGLNPNVFLHISDDGIVTIASHRSEMGQGIRSSLPILIADELGADLAHVKIFQADGDKAYGDQNTDGSNSIRGLYDDMRTAAATARQMLVITAAKRWNVEGSSCVSENSFIVHRPSKRRLSFGELAVEAGKMPIPDPKSVVHRPTAELKHLTKNMPILDGIDYVNGKAIYGADLRLPDMLIAVIARPPVVGGTVAKFNEKAALEVPGVKRVVAMPVPKAPWMFQPWGGIAVVADNTWAAMSGRSALQISWNDGENGSYNTAAHRQALSQSANKPGTVYRKVGDVDKSLKAASRRIEAEYFVPHLPHLAMEPQVALARYTKDNGGHCEIWAPTQNPQAARTEVARVLDLPESKVTVHVTLLGGGFGRKSKADFISEAAYLSKALGAPVRMQFTREDDIHNDYLNTIGVQKLVAGLDKNGKVNAWHHRTAFPPIGSLFNTSVDAPSSSDLQQGVLDFALAIPNVTAEACEGHSSVRVGWLRSVYNIFHSFAINSFIDEIAHLRKADTKDVLLEILGPARQLSLKELGVEKLANYGAPLEKHPVDAARLRAVIERVTKNAGWDRRSSLKGRALGLAAHRSFLSYCAVVASMTKRKDNSYWVDEVWLVLDAGTIVNRDRVTAQMEGSILNGMNHALYGGVSHKNGRVEQDNFDTMPIVRMGHEPRAIHIEILESTKAPGGVGEPGVPPVGPAIANALFALTGKRSRNLPLIGA